MGPLVEVGCYKWYQSLYSAENMPRRMLCPTLPRFKSAIIQINNNQCHNTEVFSKWLVSKFKRTLKLSLLRLEQY